MAFLKRANAMVMHPRVTSRGWGGIRKVASGGTGRNLTDQAREILGGSLDPDRFLFTHCTIVASVDVDVAPDVKLGTVKVGSSTVNRKYADYLIKPGCSQFVNNNGDSWSRDVLMKSYRTFVGSHNFLEHVQIEEQSKGRIIDAVARDIGDSVYVDILVATDRKHASLVAEIESGKMGTLSMGCTTDFTLCSKCGHYAVDETELCDHIKYAKLNTFMDDRGQKRVIAELCGHKDYDETGGVRFIEASWVAVPAFGGAVMRNILSPGEIEARSEDVQRVLATPPNRWSGDAIAKAAKAVRSFEFGSSDEPAEEAPKEEKPAAPFDELADEVYSMVTDKVRKRIQSEIDAKSRKEESGLDSTWQNDSVIKEARVASADAYKASINAVVRIASGPTALVEGVAQVNSAFGVRVGPEVYRAVLSTGGTRLGSDPRSFIASVRRHVGRELSPAELRLAVRVGTLLSRWESAQPVRNNP
jgi:hypothetical protein